MSKLKTLPLSLNLETKKVLKKLTFAHRALAELKGITEVIPNQGILISTLCLQEAKESSAIENIITTHDEIYKSDTATKQFTSREAKEVHSYASALRNGYDQIKKSGLLTSNYIIEIQSTIEGNNAGFRTLPGTELKNDQTNEVVYTPPQSALEVQQLMENLEQYINNDAIDETDHLIKMAVIHHQFESIHPFYDGNGRTGRIINVLYLVKNSLLHVPVLYLSRYINQNKVEYYRLLQLVRESEEAWEVWVLFVLDAVINTSYQTINQIQKIRDMMLHHKREIRDKLPKVYSQDLLNNLFHHPYTKVDFLTHDLQIHRNTAKKYLDSLVEIGLLTKHKVGKENFYINNDLFSLLQTPLNA